MQHCRKLMRGKFCGMKEAEGGEVKWWSLSNEEVRTRLMVFTGTIASELQYRRVRWLQQIGKHPSDNTGMPATLIGVYAWEQAPQLHCSGRLTSYANPWLQQSMEDISYVSELDCDFAVDFACLGWFSIFLSDAFHSYGDYSFKLFLNLGWPLDLMFC